MCANRRPHRPPVRPGENVGARLQSDLRARARPRFAKKGVRRDEETREWILYYTDRFGRNITRKNLRGRFRGSRLARAAQPRTGARRAVPRALVRA